MHSKMVWLHQKRGVILIAVVAVATLWLSVTEQIGLYIHPRYNTFSIIASLVGVALALWAVNSKADKAAQSRNSLTLALLLVLASLMCLLVIRPATLSSSIATQRGVNSAANTETLSKLSSLNVVSPFGNSVTTQLTVKDWSNLLQQTNDQAFFADKQANVSGFIAADDQSDPSVFFVSRFVVSCCAVDARPIGLPVYMPNWQNSYKPDQWVEVKGDFKVVDGRILLDRPDIKPIGVPEDPYVY